MIAEAEQNDGYVYRDRIDRRAAGETVAIFYATRYPHSCEATWSELIAAGHVNLNGRPTTPETKLRPHDRLAYARAPWVEPAVPWNVCVAHEDTACAALDKPAGLPVLPDAHHLRHTLLRWVRDRYGRTATPVHRLDRGTSGLVLVSRDRSAARALSAQFASGRVTRRYRALVTGTTLPDTLLIEQPIGRVPYAPTRELHAATPDGAPSRTRVTVLSRDAARDVSLVEIELMTGRPHQIRIHLAWSGAPLSGDRLYGAGGRPHSGVGRLPLPGDGGYELRAYRLAFEHPENGRRVEVTAELPASLR